MSTPTVATITWPWSQYLFYRPIEDRRLSRPSYWNEDTEHWYAGCRPYIRIAVVRSILWTEYGHYVIRPLLHWGLYAFCVHVSLCIYPNSLSLNLLPPQITWHRLPLSGINDGVISGCHSSRMNCAEVAGDRPRQRAYESFGIKRRF